MSVKEKIMKIPYLVTLCTVLVVGGTLTAGMTNALDKADEEKTPLVESWLRTKSQTAVFADTRAKGRQLDAKTTKGVVMLRGKDNFPAGKPEAKDITKELDSVKRDTEVVAPSRREAAEESQGSAEFDVKDRATKFRDLHANRLKLKIITSTYLGLMKP